MPVNEDGIIRRDRGSGWIAWSDCYWLFAKAQCKDAARAEQILQEGLASPSVENRADILERLQLFYEETRRDDEATGVGKKIKQSREPETTTTGRGAFKVRRNDPCPCGSGKKFKKCCAWKTQ